LMPDFIRHPFRPMYLGMMALILIAGVLGMAMPVYVAMMDEKVSKLLALPVMLVFGLLLMYDRKLSLVVILFFRAGIETVLDLTKFSLGGFPIGIGGLLNATVIMIAIMLVFEQPKVVPRRAFVQWAPFIVLTFLGMIQAPDRSDGIRLALSLVSYFAMFISGFYFGRSRAEFRSAIKLIVWSSAIPALYSFVDVALHHNPTFRLASTFAHPNVLAFYLNVIISLTFYLLQTMPANTHVSRRLMLTGYLFLLLGMLLLTKTRSAWAATAIGFIFYGLIFDRRYLIYIVVGGALALCLPGVGDRLLDLTQGNEIKTYATLNSFSWRVFLWQSALQWMSPISYVVGNGLLSFKHFSIGFFPQASGINWNAHSVFVQLLFELGALGLVSYLWLSWRSIRGLWSLLKIDRLATFSLILLVLNFLVCAFSDNMFDYLTYDWYWWFGVGAGCSLAIHAVTTPQVSAVVSEVRRG
jgi:hypothetical protein